MYPKSAANRLSGMHSAQILPGRGPFRCTGPSNHAWGANPAIPPTAPNSTSACNPCATAPSGHSGHRQQHQRRHPPAERPRRKRSPPCSTEAQRKSLATANPYATRPTPPRTPPYPRYPPPAPQTLTAPRANQQPSAGLRFVPSKARTHHTYLSAAPVAGFSS